MKKNGFLIAQNGGLTTFFTASSAYDRAEWKPLKEATIYPTAELAQNAMQKLFANGAYSARLVEAAQMQFEFPDEGPNKNQPPVASGEISDDQMDDEMTAGQDLDNEDELNLDDDEIELDDDRNDEFGQEEEPIDSNFPPMEDNEQSFLSPMERRMMQGRRPKFPNGNGPMRENFTIPKAGQGIASTPDNKTFASDLPKPELVKFQQDTRSERDSNFASDIEPLYQDVQIPANVMSAINDTINTFNKAADFNNGRDDSQASLALTVVDALTAIKDCLQQGTHEGLKQAQIKITTLMNPITTNFPPELMDFLYKSGRQPMSLKNSFYDKWDQKRQQKAENL